MPQNKEGKGASGGLLFASVKGILKRADIRKRRDDDWRTYSEPRHFTSSEKAKIQIFPSKDQVGYQTSVWTEIIVARFLVHVPCDMPFQDGRYLPPIATPILSTYQKDFNSQDVDPAKSNKHKFTSSLPPINYSRHRKDTDTVYNDEFQGVFALPALSAKPAAYKYPSKDPFETSTYRANFGRTTKPRQETLPTVIGCGLIDFHP
ncbi:hypothetical protein P5673_013692 [Acropora cervicornis]|uniref:Uncharacterized protein n=1 Tax=Acropora cervicornis TaxID=6130 RepID=A0AAD9QL76_ACRCE|nr:hypothetical protein P5673_013692 [Acropora cervicornis]